MEKNLGRRDFLGLIGAGIASVMLPNSAASSRTNKKPNFILIFADDLGYGDISGFGLKDSSVKTQNLDRMAAEGAKLTHFYVPTPYCAPSRATILTGRYPFRTGVVFNPAPDAGINAYAKGYAGGVQGASRTDGYGPGGGDKSSGNSNRRDAA